MILGLVPGGLTGCEQEGPAERVGENLDHAVEAVEEKTEKLASEIEGEGPAEKLGRKIDEGAEDTKEALRDATNQ